MNKTQILINKKYGGFSFNKEMVEWLFKNRNWIIEDKKNYNYKLKNTYPINMLFVNEKFTDIIHPKINEIELRSNKDLIDCFIELKKLHKDDVYPDAFYGHIHTFSLIELTIFLDIENYNDGIERVNSFITQEKVELKYE